MQRCWIASHLGLLFVFFTPDVIASSIPFSVRTKRSASQGKAIMERVFLILAFAVIFLIFLSRYIHLRARSRNISHFFSFAQVPEAPNRPSHLELPRSYTMTTLPRIYDPQSNRTHTRGLDIDDFGRRASRRDPDNGDLDEKDRLPPYDKKGGPPQYPGVEMGVPTITTPTGHDNGHDAQMSNSPPSYGGFRPPEAALCSSNM